MFARLKSLLTSRMRGRPRSRGVPVSVSGAVTEMPNALTTATVCATPGAPLVVVTPALPHYILAVDAHGSLLCWCAATGALLATASHAHGHGELPTSLAFVPHAKAVSGDACGVIKVWTLPSLMCLRSIDAHMGPLSLVAAPGPAAEPVRLVSAAAGDASLYAWLVGVERAELIRRPDAAAITAHVFLPDSDILVFATELPGLTLVHLRELRLETLGSGASAAAAVDALVVVSPDHLVSVDVFGKIVLWSAPKMEPLGSVPLPVDAFGKALAAVASSSAPLRLVSPVALDARTAAPLLVAGLGAGFVIADAASGLFVVSVPAAHAAPVTAVLPLENGARVLTGAVDGSLKVWGDARSAESPRAPYGFDFADAAAPNKAEPIVLGELHIFGSAVASLHALGPTALIAVSADGELVILRYAADELRALTVAASLDMYLASLGLELSPDATAASLATPPRGCTGAVAPAGAGGGVNDDTNDVPDDEADEYGSTLSRHSSALFYECNTFEGTSPPGVVDNPEQFYTPAAGPGSSLQARPGPSLGFSPSSSPSPNPSTSTALSPGSSGEWSATVRGGPLPLNLDTSVSSITATPPATPVALPADDRASPVPEEAEAEAVQDVA
ncbi:uncharacterized protein AMSG_09549 [Thecamonas trahens ATCC 50062]|uniref:Uncharacterized protein n=1 Tax=Thecamonas trahens ATCC 50062 TaxID=461836 RepID=A0A0L0DNR9_THETB|nr:hypothetical protein AMSG_09549 [Thecamonas trahens ATCC 50062]KNC53910.1 hypothetical protein AMSG_09549 [Thecamonas trahens ATCC 50062]|eukprot:XP_013754116.1 hypothetical protein AMSG_09549 [Thecamonas trahens ATCC 50062]